MPSSLGPAEILVILVVALIVLGPNKLPQAGRQVGRALAEVRRWTQDVKSEVSQAFDPTPEPPRAPVMDPDPTVDPTIESSLEVIPPASADAQRVEPAVTAATAPAEPTDAGEAPADRPVPGHPQASGSETSPGE